MIIIMIKPNYMSTYVNTRPWSLLKIGSSQTFKGALSSRASGCRLILMMNISKENSLLIIKDTLKMIENVSEKINRSVFYFFNMFRKSPRSIRGQIDQV